MKESFVKRRNGDIMYNPQLDTFVAVAEQGSFSKAAEKLYITPTAVMKQINALESISALLFSCEPITVLR